MSDIAGLLKSEITRLSRKAVREQTKVLQSASSQHRHHIAALKKQVLQLQREISRLRKTSGAASGGASGRARPALESEPSEKHRFVAKGLKSLRLRLDLSAKDLATLLDVSAQTIYNWETKKTAPRAEQLAAIAALRGIGKKEVRARLQGLQPSAVE